MDRGAERNEATVGGREAICLASYSYLVLLPVLTPHPPLACTWITDNACASFSKGLPLFKPLQCRSIANGIFPLQTG